MLQRSSYSLIFMLLSCSRASAAAQSWVAGQHNMQPADSQLIGCVPTAQSKGTCATLASYTMVLVVGPVQYQDPVPCLFAGNASMSSGILSSKSSKSCACANADV